MLCSELCADWVHFECEKDKFSGGCRNHSDELLISYLQCMESIWLTQLFLAIRVLSCESNCSSINLEGRAKPMRVVVMQLSHKASEYWHSPFHIYFLVL